VVISVLFNYFQWSVNVSIFCSDAPKIFEKVVIHINGYTGDFKNNVCSSKLSW